MNSKPNATVQSSKRKRASSPIASSSRVNNANPVNTFNDDASRKIQFFKSKADSESAKKISAARAANKYIAETVILNSAVTEVIKICNDGLHEFKNVERVKTADESSDLPTKFHNAALKLVAETKKSQGLLTTVNHVLAACNKTSERLRTKRIDCLKKEHFVSTSTEHRRTVATSSKPDNQFLKVKKKIRFSNAIAQTKVVEVVTIETDDKIEIEIPFKEHSGPNNDQKSLSITFENNNSEEIIAKFRNRLNNETLDLSTFQISQSESEIANDCLDTSAKKVLSPTNYDESLTFEETDAEIAEEFSTVESDGFSDPPPKMSEECKNEHEKFKAADNRSRGCFASKRWLMKK